MIWTFPSISVDKMHASHLNTTIFKYTCDWTNNTSIIVLGKHKSHTRASELKEDALLSLVISRN